MSEPNTEALPSDDEAALKKRLLTRVAIAGGVVVALLGGLAVFDAVFVTPPPAPVAAAPEPIAAAAAPEPKVEAKPEPPVVEEQPKAAVEAPAAVPERTTQTQRPLTPPATARQAMIKPAEPLAAQPSTAAPLSRPLSKAVQGAREYVVQLGVFNNVTNAEELRAKLELNGIPARIEARVQVGPFASQAEAQAARDRLRALGMDTGMLMAIRR